MSSSIYIHIDDALKMSVSRRSKWRAPEDLQG